MAKEAAKDDLLYEKNFRDSLGNVTQTGKRLKIYPKKPRGRYHTARRFTSALLLLFLFTAPFIKVGGHPLLLFDILGRKFVLFGLPFWPQDFHLFLLAMLAGVIAVVLFTTVFGRLWCGWACPQTVFMEMVFRKIEYWIEGDASSQRRLDQAPLSAAKIARKTLKHGLFFALSFAVANTFLAYIIGVDELWIIITDPPSQHLQGLGIITLFSLVFYGVFARFREQACIVVCPYGRFQSVMVNRETLAVTYDHPRGEPRSKLSRGATAAGAGDCIDCKQCVHVCPTGIDIRNGIQMECVNCTACIDACDTIMDRVEKPRGLIRYASLNSLQERGNNSRQTLRVVGYSTILVGLLGALVFLFATRPDFQAVILREPGQLFNELPGDRYSNFYRYKIINKTFAQMPVSIRLQDSPQGVITLLGPLQPVDPQAIIEGRFFVALPAQAVKPGRNPIHFSVYSGDELIDTIESGFLAPPRKQIP
ncbi:MAG: cytochrome c oxidase accessory protein CcoG [Candidatus Latescibacteria bacterium]|nr:cytochrome c oxidase accessory protein CcoG [Candidatus Latescibacterota bacterium]